MVANRGLSDRKELSLEKNTFRIVCEAEVRGRKPAANAMRVFEALCDGGDSAGALDELALFRALQTCGYRSRSRRFLRLGLAGRADWAWRWKIIRDAIVERNLGLVWSMIAQFGSSAVDRDEQVSAAMMTLLKAVDGFNPWLGFKFSTYACNAIRRSLFLTMRQRGKNRMFCSLEPGAVIEQPVVGDDGLSLYSERVSRAIDRNLGELSEREVRVVASRFPLNGTSSLTLGQVGKLLGLSKERVRQIQKTALVKLRKVLEADPVLQ